MKKLLIGLVLLTLILINSTCLAINEEEAKKYLDKDVFVVVTYTTSCGIYGRITDVLYIKEELYIILDTNYWQGNKLMFLKTKNITYIRKRKTYE